MTKWVYGFGDSAAEGRADMRNLLGGKGAGLAEMSNLGLPVPPGFTITTESAPTTTHTANPIRRSCGSRLPKGSPRSSGRSAHALEMPTTRCWSRCAQGLASRCRG